MNVVSKMVLGLVGRVQITREGGGGRVEPVLKKRPSFAERDGEANNTEMKMHAKSNPADLQRQGWVSGVGKGCTQSALVIMRGKMSPRVKKFIGCILKGKRPIIRVVKITVIGAIARMTVGIQPRVGPPEIRPLTNRKRCYGVGCKYPPAMPAINSNVIPPSSPPGNIPGSAF